MTTGQEISAHTPGPWHWEKARTVQHLHAKDGNFAQVSMPAQSPQGFKGRYEADAALIAAAPELLAAAEAVLEGLHARIDAAKDSTPVFTGIAALHDAISKARGRS